MGSRAAFQNRSSSSTTGRPRTSPSRLARVDLPAAPGPRMTTRFRLPSCRKWQGDVAVAAVEAGHPRTTGLPPASARPNRRIAEILYVLVPVGRGRSPGDCYAIGIEALGDPGRFIRWRRPPDGYE